MLSVLPNRTEPSPSMRRPVSVKSVLQLPLVVEWSSSNRSASAAILPSALFCERWFARCQLGVLVSVGAATCESTSAPISWTGVGPGLGRSHLNSAVPLDESNPTLCHCAFDGSLVVQWFVNLAAHPQLVKQYRQLPSNRNHRTFLGVASSALAQF